MTGRGMTGERSVNVARTPSAEGEAAALAAGLTHAALLYRGGDDLGELAAVLRRAVGTNDPLHVAVPDETMRADQRVLAASARRLAPGRHDGARPQSGQDHLSWSVV